MGDGINRDTGFGGTIIGTTGLLQGLQRKCRVCRYRHLTVSSGSGKSHPAAGCILLASISISVSFNQPSVNQGDTLYGG